MWRAFIEAVGPFLVPFALYALWIAALKRAGPAGGTAAGDPPRAHPGDEMGPMEVDQDG